MKRSLYLRIVATFISVVLLSLVASYFITSLFFHQEVIFEEEVHNVTSQVVDLVEITEHDKMPDLVDTLRELNLEILIVNEQGENYTGTFPTFTVARDVAQQVVHSPHDSPVALPYAEREETRVLGIPITINNEPYALFVTFNYGEEVNTLKRITLVALFLVLLIGSGLILFASRYFVTPIKKLSSAAQKVATGDFNVRLKSKNKDEIGELITNFNHMASELGKIDKMRDDFVSNVSHEIQSPLTSIKGFTKALRDDVIPKEHQKEYLDIIYQESDRLSRLGENLLQLASLDSEHHPYHPETYRIDEQIRRTVVATEPLWSEKNIHINLELAAHEVYADQDLFEQVWLNLITNAIKYSEEDGTVEILLESDDEELNVTIKDSGKGIPEEDIPHLYERFYKVDQARSSAVKGNGLGLSIVRKILNLHGCSISVQSKAGVGSAFTVTIPIKSEGDDQP
ncbi:sensor histidine kinase [Desertibacillus haloalkaliphilus]|uniref:sensor histidine kinase n=1 Tax=Desertibacillus haloalkaliphilus TaxID=1328930 RepID=UPI001C262E6E|nr:HAMP domain-containing sensor histidine kinase [Desertibacillus haloalkaliphilus]MBU8906672.1 HAMP domain-containing histidine kinase [Desertibacillus haloalkaliphilus]